MTSRKDFLRTGTLLAGGAAAGLLSDRGGRLLHPSVPGPFAGALRGRSRPSRSLRILILGGTGFIGPHMVRTAVERGHVVTLFNRGRSEPELFEEAFVGLENLVGDRNGDLESLEGGTWDVVIDNSGYTPDQVRATAQLLSGSAGQYIFTSTRAVYTDYTHPTMDEDAPIGMAGVPLEDWTGYGPLKAAAEFEVREAFPDGTSIVRPPIITGPLDGTDRFTYWYHRIDQGGEVLAPGVPDDPVQYVDVRDLAEFFIHLAEEGITGAFNPEAPAAPLTTAEFLYGVRAITAAPVRFTWVDWDFLAERGLNGGAELPAWREPAGDWLNYGRMDNSRALEAGIRFRPLADTARDTLAWWYEAVGEDRPGAGISREVEAQVLAEWGASGRSG